ncbi:Chalcone synthase [Hordeum vulgare]|nr:Chalcone synthase [Hordeum vulgare]
MGSNTLSSVREIRHSQRANGPAAILAIGTANPPNCVSQKEYPDYYFRVTKSQHLTDLKQNSVTSRYFHHTEELLDAHPEFLCRDTPSLDARLDIAAAAAPELAALAAAKAIAEWGCPATDITHLVISTNSGAHAPGIDLRLSLSSACVCPSAGPCSTSTAAPAVPPRCASPRTLAENNRGARVLVACVELTVVSFRGPEEAYPHKLISQAVFGDGAGAVIVGADAVHSIERPLFEMVSASQNTIPATTACSPCSSRKPASTGTSSPGSSFL